MLLRAGGHHHLGADLRDAEIVQLGVALGLDAEMLDAPEIVMPAGAPVPDFVKPCDQDVVDLYNKVWTRLKQ